MSRVCAILVSCVLLQALVPTTAYAWWEYIEAWSGPGPWKGFDIEARLVCFVDTSGNRGPRVAASGLTATARARSEGMNLKAGAGSNDDKWKLAMDGWRDAALAWETIAGASAYKAVEARREARQLEMEAKDDKAFLDDAAMAYERMAKAMEALSADGDVRAFSAPGLLYSACSLKSGERRRAAIDLGMRFVWTKDDDRFADGKRISLTTIEPTFSWSIIDNPKFDFLEYGLGAGMYWVSSEAFPSFSGGFLEPVRIEIHAPTNAHWLAKILVFRAGLLVFPGGFAPGAFAARPDVAHRISRDWVKTYGIYADLEPLVRWLNGHRP